MMTSTSHDLPTHYYRHHRQECLLKNQEEKVSAFFYIHIRFAKFTFESKFKKCLPKSKLIHDFDNFYFALMTATIQNVVSTANLSTHVDLVTLAWIYSGKYIPKSFAACQLKLCYPKTTALIFASGKIVCTGAKSIRMSRIALFMYLKLVCKIHHSAKLKNIAIQNLVASSFLNHKVNLGQLHKDRISIVQYDPDIFPGARITIPLNHIHASVFLSGKLIISGGKSTEDIENALRHVMDICAPFLRTEKHDVDTEVEHRDITITMQSLKNL